MRDNKTTTIRVNIKTHNILRWLAYKRNQSITEIIDDFCKGKGPSSLDRLDRMVNEKK